MFGELVHVVGMELCPCEHPKRCGFFEICRDEGVVCWNFKSWTDRGKKNNKARFPTETLDGKKFTFDI